MPHGMFKYAEWLSPRKATTGFLAGERDFQNLPSPWPLSFPPSVSRHPLAFLVPPVSKEQRMFTLGSEAGMALMSEA